MSDSDDITVDGSAMSTVPSFNFCSSSLSPPSWLEPNTTTLALLPSLALARRANSSAELANKEPGSPTWPNLISIWASAGTAASEASVASAAVRAWRNVIGLLQEGGRRSCAGADDDGSNIAPSQVKYLRPAPMRG